MGEIYCLYSTEDGVPRYVGCTDSTASRRYNKHVTSAMERSEGRLYDWMRDVWRRQLEVEYYVLQTDVNPAELDFYERYWIEQFSNLLNTRNSGDQPDTSEIGQKVIEAIRSILAERNI